MVVVLGAQRDTVALELSGLPVHTVAHAEWAAGPGGSLVAGVRALGGTVDAVLVMLCDQLRVDSAHLRALVETWQRTRADVVASTYEETRGVPALFSLAVFPELEALGSEQGARGVIAREPSRVAEVPLPGGGEDVDTAADLARLK